MDWNWQYYLHLDLNKSNLTSNRTSADLTTNGMRPTTTVPPTNKTWQINDQLMKKMTEAVKCLHCATTAVNMTNYHNKRDARDLASVLKDRLNIKLLDRLKRLPLTRNPGYTVQLTTVSNLRHCATSAKHYTLQKLYKPYINASYP